MEQWRSRSERLAAVLSETASVAPLESMPWTSDQLAARTWIVRAAASRFCSPVDGSLLRRTEAVGEGTSKRLKEAHAGRSVPWPTMRWGGWAPV